ncbi:MAG: NAD(P)H-hydrate dehydratase [Vulcanimicrobiaceae bacterium]
MTYVLEPEAMRAADTQACATIGANALTQQAGARIAQAIRERIPQGGRIIAFAGPGNNGGDAFAALAELEARYERIVFAHDVAQPSDARAAAQARAHAAGVASAPFPETASDAERAVRDCTLAVDGLFGTGARLPIDGRFHAAIGVLDARQRDVLAIDIPSGIDAGTGAADAHAVRASVTIALAAAKPGLLIDPGREYAGSLYVADIGIDPGILAGHARSFAALDDRAFLDLLPQRSARADKRTSGAPLIIAGSEQFPGAAVLVSHAAGRAGAGYVTLATATAAAPAIRSHLVETVVVSISADDGPKEAVEDLLDVAKRNDAIAIGPGLGLNERTGEIVRGVVERSALPIVADAGALYHLAKHLDIARGKPIVITPHEGEFARLSGLGAIAPGQRVQRLREFVDRTGITTLLKGRDTLIYDGRIMHVNVTGTNALATAGSGDVLTGIIATLLAQGLSPLDAARCGAYWHGLAGQLCARRRPVGTLAGDIPETLADAIPQRALPTGLTRVF